ncbi:MAG TPA: hypothetical protein VKV05_08635, partial [Terriglobales bacterium]|nr:hypothetical protein [Terriglobales bacterium]
MTAIESLGDRNVQDNGAFQDPHTYMTALDSPHHRFIDVSSQNLEVVPVTSKALNPNSRKQRRSKRAQVMQILSSSMK